ncbi:type I secretion system permease/ATPase [Aquisediminimonas sediminicola]|uniref:type I secretion system permease/ATPase n=1 Tax=Alteraquisediminimonas sediminicola TaxID=2676787 RepID=UPI001FEC2931|nr:type I secretion system permease/ATPase [Aquisediminimonas sediminicola]
MGWRLQGGVYQMHDLRSPASILQAALLAARRHFVWAAGFSALLNLLYIAPTLYMLQIYDRVVPTRGGLTLVYLTLVLVFALGTLSLLDLVRSRLLVRASMRLDRMLAGAIVEASLDHRGGTRETMSKQALREFDTLRQALSGGAILAVLDAPWTPIYILVCMLIHPALGLLALIGAGLIVMVAWRNEKATHDPLKRANEAANRAYTGLEQSLAGAEAIRALGMRGAMVQRHVAAREEMIALQSGASFAAGRYTTFSKFLRMLLQSLALGLGALLAIDGLISPGAIFAASFLLGRALAPIDLIVGNWRSVVQAQGAMQTLESLLAEKPLSLALTHLPPPDGRLSIESLLVLNARKDAPILADVSFKTEPGEIVAIVGPSGAGKSTLARVISGGIAADRGAIRFDGAERADWDQERLARHIGYLPQSTSLFAGSVRDNIARFDVGSGDDRRQMDEEVIRAAKECGAHDMILRLPQGYDTPLGWGGSGLSAGQAQRVALARALYGRPSVIILDEPNAHLDADGEVSLVNVLVKMKEERKTVLIIAHRMGIMAAVDKVLVVNNGRVEMFGPRDEVLTRLKQAPPAITKAA